MTIGLYSFRVNNNLKVSVHCAIIYTMNELIRVESSSNSNYANGIGFAMVRPDAMDCHLDSEIIHRIEQSGLHILKRKISTLSEEHVDGIYRNLLNRPYYQPLRSSLVGRVAMSLIVGGSDNVSAQLTAMKGSAEDTCGTIRGDLSAGHLLNGDLYTDYINEQLSPAQLDSPEWSKVLRDDRIHTDETSEEAMNSIHTIFSRYELADLGNFIPPPKS